MRECSTSDALREALTESLRADRNVFVMGEDIGVYGGAFGVTRGLLDSFGPDRIVNTPISEQGFTGMAIGAALVGARPVIEIMFMDFITLIMDPVVNQAAKLRYVFGPQARCPLVIRTPTGGGRCYGPTHSQSLEAWFMHVPGIKIAAPGTPADAKGLLKTAIRDDNPVLFLEHKLLYPVRGPVPQRGRAVPFGKAVRVRRGLDVTIVAWSWMRTLAERAADELLEFDITVDLIDPRTLVPFDIEAVLASVRRTGRLVIVDEGHGTAGISAELAARVGEQAFDHLDAPIRRVTTADVPVPASPALERAALPSSDRIVEAVLELLQ